MLYVEELEQLNEKELIDYVLDLEEYICKLERDLRISKEKYSNKIQRDYEHNMNMLVNAFNNIGKIKECVK